MTLMCLFYL